MRIIWSIPARNDLRGINDWLDREASPEFAVRTLAAIRYRAKVLEDFPRSGRPHLDGQRILRVYGTPYLIRYQVDDQRVEVVRVHHEHQAWQLED
jgi:toxin ParE1/3/4